MPKWKRCACRFDAPMLSSSRAREGRAEQLGEAAVFYNDPSLVNTWPARYNAVTKQRIQEVARTYFIPSNRTVVTTVPKPEAATAGKEK